MTLAVIKTSAAARSVTISNLSAHKCLFWKFDLTAGERQRFFRSGDINGINAQHVARLRRLPTTLNRSVGPAGMSLPGYRLHRLKGERAGQ
jgi:hypothetical protein